MPDAARIALIRRMRAAGATWAAVGTALGIHATSAVSYARLRCPDALGVKRSRPRRASESVGPSVKLLRIQGLRRAGYSWRRIGEVLGIRGSAARAYGLRHDPTLRTHPPRY